MQFSVSEYYHYEDENGALRITTFLYFQKPDTNNKITCSTENVSTCFNAATANSTAQL